MTTSDSSSRASKQAGEDVAKPTFDVALPYVDAGSNIHRLDFSGRQVPRGEMPSFALKKKELFLPPGLTLVSGPTGVGKTTAIQAMIRASSGRLAYINLLEPFNQIAEIESNPVTYSLREAIELSALTIAMGIVPVIDSLRILTYTSSGATGKRGINMGMFGYLTALNNSLAQAGASMIAVINPLLDEKEDYDAFISNCRSSVVSVIEVLANGRLSVSRRPDRDKRENYSFDPEHREPIERSPALDQVLQMNASGNFPDSANAAASRSRVRQLSANATGTMLKGKVNLLND